MATSKTPAPDRGPEAVKASLIKAACEVLAEVGPNAMSVRTVATRAGVNHGQVHHYFGSKQGLIAAATHHLATEHFEHAHQRAKEKGESVPPALTLGQDSQYLRAIVRLVLDGDIETATREIAEGISIPDEMQRLMTRQYGDEVPPDVRARIALTFAIELGWAALEPYIMQIANVQADEAEEVREHARTLSRTFLNELADNLDQDA
ncbi:MAG: TetR family transcriptional regulator [Pseudomonadales bacterium]